MTTKSQPSSFYVNIRLNIEKLVILNKSSQILALLTPDLGLVKSRS